MGWFGKRQQGLSHAKSVEVESGHLVFTETTESISGYIMDGTKRWVNNKLLQKRSLPSIGKDFHFTGERYEMWEVYLGRTSLYFKTLAEAEIYVLTH